MAKPLNKYRPSLPAHLITHILNLAKQDMSTSSMELIGILAPFQAKIDNLSIAPAYITSPRETTLQALGGEDGLLGDLYRFQDNVYCNKEEYWEACYKVYKLNPISLTLAEIQAAKEHMYLNDLMTPEEMVEFEKASFNNL